MEPGYTLRDYNVDDIRDAERLVNLFATFDSAWPGGFMRGVTPTPEYMYEAMRRSRYLATCVVEFQGRMVGMCNLHAETGNTDLAYIPLLGADPAHHGKGVGKALLLEMIKRVTGLGFRELTLHTWGGNLKAVPLYKKTGFNWEPETSVHMRNFLPGLLNSAAGREFFHGRDWYTCFDREIGIEPDDETWRGMRVFRYMFRLEDRFLNATFEMASGGMTALETNEYLVYCAVPTAEGEAPAGETLPIVWHIEPRSVQPLEVILLTEADDGLNIQVREHLRLTGPADIERELRVLPAAQPRHSGRRERCVRSTLVLNGSPIVLETGVRVVRPISIQYAGQGLYPGREESIVIRIASNLDRDVAGTLSMDAHPNLAGSGTSREFTLPARMAAQCEFRLTGKQPGACLTNLRYAAGSLQGDRPLTFRVYGSIAPIAAIDPVFDEQIVVDSPGMEITQKLRGGNLSIENRSSGHSYRLIMPEPGPPFVDFRRQRLMMTGRIEQRGGDTAAVVRAEYPEFPGLAVERSVTQLAGDLVRIDFQLINATGAAMPVKLRIGLSRDSSSHIVLPVAGGIVREPRRDWDPFPLGGEDVLERPDAFEESWIAAECDRNVSGLIWHGKAELEMDWRTGLTLDAGEIPAYGTEALDPIYAVVGAGTWETVRTWWRRLAQPSQVKEQPHPEAKRVLTVRTGQTPLLLFGDRTTSELIVENRRKLALTGTAALSGQGLDIDPGSFELTDVSRGRRADIPITVCDQGGYGSGFIHAEIKTAANTRTFKLPVIRTGGPGLVTVSEQQDGRYLIDNGVLRYTFAPGFLGAITSLEADGKNHLHSAWPSAGTFVWANPWYGGIHLYLDWIGDERLACEEFTGEPVERTGASGAVWKGVRATCRPKHRSLRWLAAEAAYLTLPGSDLVALLYRWTNGSDAKQSIDGGLAVWAAPGGDRANAVAHWSERGELRHRRRAMPGMDVTEGRWAAIENPVTGHRLEIVAPEKDAHTFIDDMCEEGAHLGAGGRLALEPQETREQIAWLIVNPAVSEFEAYSELKQVQTLP